MKRKERKESQKSDSLSKYTMKDEQNTVVLDFSRIPAKDFEQVLTDLVKMGKSQIQSLVISTDHYREIHPDEFPSAENKAPQIKSGKEDSLLQNSAYLANPKAIKSIILAMKHILQKTESLTSIKFRSIIFPQSDLEVLVTYLKANTKLKSISFDTVPLYDKGFHIVVQCARRERTKNEEKTEDQTILPQIETFECSSCGITDDSIPDIKRLLNFHHSVIGEEYFNSSLHGGGEFSNNCIKELILRGNSLSQGALFEIGFHIVDIPILFVDLSYNKEMDEKIAANLRKSAPHCELIINKEERSQTPKYPKKTSPMNEQDDYLYGVQYRSSSQPYYGDNQYQDYPEQYQHQEVIQPIPYYQKQAQKNPKSSPKKKATKQKSQHAPPPNHQDDIEIPSFDLQFESDDSGPEDEAVIGVDLKVVGPRAKEFAKYLQCLSQTLAALEAKKRKEEEEKAIFMKHKTVSKRPNKRASSVKSRRSRN